MSGGVAYVWNPDGDFETRFNSNHGLCLLEGVTDEADIEELRLLIERHQRYTRSDRAAWILQNWEYILPQFVKVVSLEYRRAQAERAAQLVAV